MNSQLTFTPPRVPPPPEGTPGKRAAITAGNRLRITELIRCGGTAVGAAMICFPMLLAKRPRTPLRVLGIAVFEYLARLRGATLGKCRRLAIAYACDLGSLRDDYYDHHRLDVMEYRFLRLELRRTAPEPATSHFIQLLRNAERSRPILEPGIPAITDAVIAYRTHVLELMLQWVQAISGVSFEPVKFQSILSTLGLMQLADDVLDWKDDEAERRPSYVTAILLRGSPSSVASPLRAQADALLPCTLGAARQDAGAVVFAVAGVLTWSFVVVLLRLRFPQ